MSSRRAWLRALKAGRTGIRPVALCAKGGDADGRYQGRADRTDPDDHEVRLAATGDRDDVDPGPPRVEEAGLAIPALCGGGGRIPPSGGRRGDAVRLARRPYSRRAKALWRVGVELELVAASLTGRRGGLYYPGVQGGAGREHTANGPPHPEVVAGISKGLPVDPPLLPWPTGRGGSAPFISVAPRQRLLCHRPDALSARLRRRFVI